MVHALQKGKLLASKVSPEIRRMAKTMNPTDVLHFAKTKHDGLPEHVKQANNAKFMAVVRQLHAGQKGLETSSPSVVAAAKKVMPRDRDAMPLENGMTSSAALTKMSAAGLLLQSRLITKQADVHSILAKTHKAMHQAGTKHRELLRKELEKVKQHNMKLQSEVDQSRSKIMTAEQKQQEAEMNATLAAKSIEQLQMVQQSQRTPPPPEQPAYGHMLFGQPPGGAPMAAPGQQQPTQSLWVINEFFSI